MISLFYVKDFCEMSKEEYQLCIFSTALNTILLELLLHNPPLKRMQLKNTLFKTSHSFQLVLHKRNYILYGFNTLELHILLQRKFFVSSDI